MSMRILSILTCYNRLENLSKLNSGRQIWPLSLFSSFPFLKICRGTSLCCHHSPSLLCLISIYLFLVHRKHVERTTDSLIKTEVGLFYKITWYSIRYFLQCDVKASYLPENQNPKCHAYNSAPDKDAFFASCLHPVRLMRGTYIYLCCGVLQNAFMDIWHELWSICETKTENEGNNLMYTQPPWLCEKSHAGCGCVPWERISYCFHY